MWTKKLILIGGFVIYAGCIDSVMAKENIKESVSLTDIHKIEELWAQGARPDDIQALINQIEKDKGTSGELELKKGWLLILKKDYDGARSLFLSSMKKYPEIAEKFELAVADCYVQDWHHSNDNYLNKKAVEKYAELIKTYPDYAKAYLQYSFLMLSNGDYAKAVELAEKSMSLNTNAYAARNLVIGYEKIGNYESSLNYLNAVHELDQSFYADKNMMISGAISYSQLDMYEQSLGVLKTLLSKDENLKKDPYVIQTVNKIKSRLANSEQ